MIKCRQCGLLCDCVSTHAEQQDLSWSYFRMEMVPVLVALSKGPIPFKTKCTLYYVHFFTLYKICHIYIWYRHTHAHFYVNQAIIDDTLQGFD